MLDPRVHPCQLCGACCATFRVSFYWSEADSGLNPNAVPEHLTEKLTPFRSCMKYGSDPEHPRCIALDGEIGKSVGCTIYDKRSQACQDFGASYENGEPHPRCDQARIKHGLRPLTPDDWKH